MKTNTAGTDQPNLKVGVTEVVIRKRGDEKNKEAVTTIGKGTVVQLTTHFARVYNPEKGGDTSQEAAELYPIAGKLCWLEVVGARKVPLTIAPCLR